MGKGLALAFKQRYPDMFLAYQQACTEGKIQIGKPTLYTQSSPWILNFPTKDHWKAASKIAYIEQGLIYFAHHYQEYLITSIAFPKLGTGLGGLPWEKVGPLMAQCLGNLAIESHIYITSGDHEYQPTT